MTTPFYCLFAMLLLAFLTKVPVAVAQAKVGGGRYNNRDPRSQQAQLSGWAKRALLAHQNTFEAIILFTPGVLISHFAPASAQQTAAVLALVHLGARLIYPVLYIADVHLMRSLVWGIGFVSALWMALLPALA